VSRIHGPEKPPAGPPRVLRWGDYKAYYDAMTLGEAMAVIRAEPWGCACVGGPRGAPAGACFCRLSWAQTERLHRAAHIVARLIDDASRRPA
jgi:hypothetical protein